MKCGLLPSEGAGLGGLGRMQGTMSGTKEKDKSVLAQQVIVRITNCVLVSTSQPVIAQLNTDINVYVEGRGNSARAVPQHSTDIAGQKTPLPLARQNFGA